MRPVDSLEVVSTDMPRTVETAHAVLTGLMGQTDETINIRIDAPSPWVPNTRCAQLATMMKQGREQLRQNRPAAAADTHLALIQAFSQSLAHEPRSQGAGLPGSPSFGILAVHDDCQARRWHGKAPSECVDVALCDAASREATREAMAALSAHGLPSWRLSAGPMCYQLARKIREFLDEEAVTSSGQGGKHKLMLISAHDTSIFTLLNAISKEYRESCVGGGSYTWPPYASCVTIDVMRDRCVRLARALLLNIAQAWQGNDLRSRA